MDSEENLAIRGWIAVLERVRYQLTDEPERRLVRVTIARRAISLREVDDAMHDHAAPVMEPVDFIDLERNPWMMT